MDYNKYRNCLRLQITQDDVWEERTKDLVEHCLKYGFDNVMLMINTEEFNYGHITIEEVKPWVEMFKKIAEKLRSNNISVSLNNWMEMGHVDRGRGLKEGQNFNRFTDRNGTQGSLIACPLCENWRKYHTELIRYFVRELKPDTYWIEDDFRILNHLPLANVGCYCQKHMDLYNSMLGTKYTRQEFTEKVFAKGGCTPERKALLDANRKTMVELADLFSSAAREEYPEIDVAIMTSGPMQHSLEGRNWNGLYEALSHGGKKINRIHLEYDEMNGKNYLYEFNLVSMGVRALGDDDVIILPETEHCSASTYLKSPRFLRFGLESSLPLLTSGMTYSIYDFVGNGVRESFGYGQVIKDVKPYMQAVMDLRLRFSSLSGVVVPIDEKASYNRTIYTDYTDLMPGQYNLAATVSAWGMSFRYSRDKDFCGEYVCLTSSVVECMSDEQLKKLFANNFIFVDGSAVLKLKERKLLQLINAKAAVAIPEDSGFQSYEESADSNLRIDGVRRLRASEREGAGVFVKVDYDEGVCIQTVVKNQYMEEVAPAVVCGSNFIVWPHCMESNNHKQFCDFRRYFFLQSAMKNTPNYAVCDIFGVSPYLYKEESRAAIMLSNGNFDDFDEIPLYVSGIEFNNISQIKKDGTISKISFDRHENKIIVKTSLEGLSTKVLILE